ncbi:MAG: DNA primase, partial [Alistipes sp.]|nr:DNA primase [Alistipes sp.]
TTIDTLERELAKYLLKYGHLDFVVVEDKDEYTFNVARYIFDELDADGLQLREGVYRNIVELYRTEWVSRGDGVEVPTHPFVNHADHAVSSVSIDLLTSDDSYVISKIWEQKDVHIESVEEQLSEGVPKVVILFKWRMLEGRMAELKKLIDVGDDEDEAFAANLALYTKYQAARVAIAKTVGRLI